jgi:hypothetical protein
MFTFSLVSRLALNLLLNVLDKDVISGQGSLYKEAL